MNATRIKSKKVLRIEFPFNQVLRYRMALAVAKLNLEEITSTADANRYNQAKDAIDPIHELVTALLS